MSKKTNLAKQKRKHDARIRMRKPKGLRRNPAWEAFLKGLPVMEVRVIGNPSFLAASHAAITDEPITKTVQ